MHPLRIFVPLALSIVLAACSGGDAPVAPEISSAAQADTADNSPSDTAAVPATSVSPPAASEAPPPAPASPTAAAVSPSADTDHPYEVQCAAGAAAAEQCQVDKDTYVGWRTFSAQCQVCHGGSALGSTFAPNLLDRFHERVDHARFVEVVTNGYRGQVGAMPAWKGNPNVMPHVDQLYRYLKARADGALPPGRPERKP